MAAFLVVAVFDILRLCVTATLQIGPAFRYGLLEGENPAGVAVAIYSMTVSVKAASVRNLWMQALILNQVPHKPGSLEDSRGADEGSKLISIQGHYAARP